MTEPIRIVHVTIPKDATPPPCPKCDSFEVERRGSEDWGPYWWQCEECDHQWGHV